ncbi:MAG: RDD family protein [Bacilli bacterium]|nr:RDD family protein [Bacilli bacterium]
MKNKRALFFQRFMAFMIDMVIIYLLISIVSMPFIDSKKSEDLTEKTITIMNQYRNGEIDAESYIIQYGDLTYKIAKNNGLVTVITLLLYVIYFVVYQLYKDGQTIGKRIMKIKVVSTEGKLNTNQMIFRAFIANSILVELISFMFLLFGTKDIYFYGTISFQMIQYLIIFISIIMVMSRKDGASIHDLLVHTRVVQI